MANTTKTVVALVLSIASIGFVLPMLAGAVAAPTLTIGSQSAINGATIHVPINASNFSSFTSDVGSVTLNVQYDNTLLTYVDTSFDNLPVAAQANPVAANKIGINWADASGVTPITISDGALVTLNFTVNSLVSTSTNLSFVDTNEVTDGAFDPTINPSFVGGIISLNPAATLSSIAITNPAGKLTYTVGDTLDLTGLVVTGTYSDGSTQVETITADDISGFNSSAPATDQVLTITVGEQTTTYTIDVVAGGPYYTAIFGDIKDTLASEEFGIDTNIDECAVLPQRPTDCTGLYFEKADEGRVLFTESLNLTEASTTAFLQNLGNYMNASADSNSMSFDARTAEQLQTAGAQITIYGFPHGDEVDDVTESELVVKDDNGVTIATTSEDYPTISEFTWHNSVGSVTFGTDHFTQFFLNDTIKPFIVSFSVPETSSSLTVSGITVTAHDNRGVAGLMFSESNTPPNKNDEMWSSGTPSTYLFGSEGTKTLYAWAKDAADNISSVYDGKSVTITLVSTNNPPSFDPIADQVVSENASSQDISITNVSPGSSDESDQTVTVSAASSDTSIVPDPVVTGSGANRTLTYTPVTDATGSVTITVTADDGQAENNTYSRVFTITVNAASKTGQTITFDPLADKTYGDTPFGISATASSGLTVSFSSQTSGVCIVSSGTVTIVTVGTCTIRASQDGDDDYDAALDVDRSFTVAQKSLTVSLGSLFAVSKVYDSTTDVSIAGTAGSLVGNIDGDDVSLEGPPSGIFDTKAVGEDKLVDVSGYTLAGADADNYALTKPTLTADITAKHITGSFTADDKVYDGDNTATVIGNSNSLTGVIEGDDVSLSGGTATFSDESAGTGKVVTLTGASLSGVDADNYALDSVATTTADITLPAIGGSISISGVAKFGQTLTADPTVLTNAGTPTYQWNRGGDAISGATESTYTVVEADIGTTITVTATADDIVGTGSITSAATDVVEKADGPDAPDAPTLASKTSTSITLTANSLNQFSGDGATWQDSNVFSELTPSTGYIFFARVKATATTNESAASDASETLITDVDPDIAAVAADKAALVADAIKGGNADLDNITGALTDPLPSSGDNGSTITWASSNISTISNDGQTVNRPAFTDEDAIVTMTVTISKGAQSDTKEFTLTVLKSLNSAKTITAFSFATPTASGVIEENTHTIAVTVPFGTIVTALVPTVDITGASVDPISGLAQNFTDPVLYTVTAENGSTQVYTVTVTVTAQSDFTALDAAIASAEGIDAAAVEGTAPGQYPAGSKGTLEAAILDAESVSHSADQSIVDAAVVTLNDAIAAFQASVIGPSDTSALSAAITSAQTLHDGATEGTDPGEYAVGSKATLQSAIDVAASITSAEDQTVVDAAVVTLNDAVADFEASVVATPDTTAPTITLLGSATTSVALGNVFVDSGATANDDVDGAVTPVVSGSVDTNTVGTYTLTYTATDLSDNSSSVVRDVIVSATSLEVLTTTSGGSEIGTLSNAATISTTTASGNVTIAMPADLTVSGPAGWDGTIDLPTSITTTVAPVADSDNTATAVSTIEIGFGNTLLTFDKGVRLLFAGQGGNLIGYSHGAGTFTSITSTCSADTQTVGDALTAGGDCKITVGGDLIVWTKHFSAFTTYTQTAIPTPTSAPSGSGGGGGGGGITYTYSVTINNGATAATSTAVILTMTPANANQMQISNAPDFATSTWITFQNTYSWTLTTGSGVKTVYVRYGNNGSIVANTQDNITLVEGAVLGVQTQTLQSVPQGLVGGGQVLGASVYNFTKTLQRGSKGEGVTELQRVLIANGYLKIDAPTEFFGPATEAAVKAYQKANGLEQVGVVGPKTRALLNKGTTSGTSKSDRLILIEQLQAQLKVLLAKIAALTASSTIQTQ